MSDIPSPSTDFWFCPGTTRLDVDIRSDGLVFHCPMPRLAGPHRQRLGSGKTLRPLPDGAVLENADGGMCGVLFSPDDHDPESAAAGLYDRLFAVTSGLNLHRIWNFVPAINERLNGMENYLAFNSGRHRAFTARRGEILPEMLPAASALGISGGHLALAFSAGLDPVTQFENPAQVPSCRYPEQYGRNPPLFARGSRVDHPASTTWHLSGTASIRGSSTVGATIAEQIPVTLANIQAVMGEMMVPANASGEWKVFLRSADDLEVARAAMEAGWPDHAARCLYLQADICRADLLVEVEAVFHSV